MRTCKRTALYGRVSKDGRDGRPVDDQLASLRAWAAREGVEVVAEHRDDGVSASRFAASHARPGWQSILELLASGRIDSLAVWEISRSTRDRAVWAALIAALIEVNALLVVDGKVHDPRDPDDGFMLDLGAALAVRESVVTSKRTQRGSASRAAAGRLHGRDHYGITTEYDPTTGRPVRRVLDEPRAAIVREAARRILAGETPTAVANDFNARDVPSPAGGRWIGNNLLRQIAAPVVAGLRVHRGEVLDGVVGQWPPILTMQQHRRLQQILNDPERRTTRNGAHIRHLLVGIARCGVCDGPLRTLTRKRTADTSVVYGCKQSFCVSRNAAELDAFVEDVIIERLQRPDVAAELAAAADDPEVRAAGEEAARLRAKLDEARRLVDADRLSLTSLADLEARTLPRLEAAERRARPRHIPDVVFATAGADAAERWKGTPISARREIVRALVEVRVDRAPRRGRHSAFDHASIRLTWR